MEHRFAKHGSRLTAFLLTVALLLSLLPTVVSADSALTGSGTADDPYLIGSAAAFAEFRDAVNAMENKGTSTLSAKLTSDIDLSTLETQTPIGVYKDYSNYIYYGGTFDGDGYTIRGINIDNAAAYQALFGCTKGAAIKNLTVEGSVTTSTTSSAYAAGIVAKADSTTITDCTNRVTVTASNNGYCGGIAAQMMNSSAVTNCDNKAVITAGKNGYIGGIVGQMAGSVTGCTNSAALFGCGDYIGGIIGSGGSGVTMKNCINSGNITNTATAKSYAYCVGGIAGGISATSSMERCGNTGAISSTVKRTGGVVGSAAGQITACFNLGDVTGIYSCGGVAGSITSANTKITDCYNRGDITCNTPNATFNDSNAKGVGGVVGDPSTTSATGTITNCYNAGAITNNSAIEGISIGGVVGSSAAKNYSGVATTGLVKLANCYYLAADGLTCDGADAAATGGTAKTDAEFKATGMAAALGSAYLEQAGNYPILGWQDPDAKYTVKFVLSPATATLTVKQGDAPVSAEADGSYLLKNGTYTYAVSAEECAPQSGSFTVAYSGQTINVTLQETLYDIVFTTDPADATLTVTGQTPLADGRTYRLPKSGNPYTYTAKAFGYAEATGSFHVTGGENKTVTLAALPKQNVTFGAITAADAAEITPTIKVSCTDWPNAVLAGENGAYALPAGNYQYSISCAGYKTVKGSFTVANEAVAIPATVLEIQTAWDGETYTEPQKDTESGAYLITSPDELMWFGKNATATDSATLTANIRINDDVTAENPYVWSFAQSTSYKGTFDGAGHAISGLYVTSAKSNVGFIGKLDKTGSVCNLTISDSLIVTTGSASYTGAVVGDCCGAMENCHVTSDVTLNGKGYTGGVVGELDNGCSLSKCSSAATVTGVNYVGGIAGRIYSNLSNAMSECCNSGSVTGTSYVGGLAGIIYNGGTIVDCYNLGAVKATSGVAGGITGGMRSGSIKTTYQAGSITATTAGNVVGQLEFANGQKTLDTVLVLKTDLETVGAAAGCTIQNGTATEKTAEELKASAATLGEKFAENAKGYPLLKWQTAAASEPDPDQPTADPNGWDGKTTAQPQQVDGVYRIGTAAELKWFADAVKNSTAIAGVLTTDIDLNNQNWTPIVGFAGTFDGANHAITNFYCKTSGAAALFLSNGGTIKNVMLRGKLIGGDATAMVSENSGTLSNVTSYAAVKGGNRVAGIAALNMGSIDGCANHGNVSGVQYVGGICGENKGSASGDATVKNSVNTGMIRSDGHMLGGVVGNNEGYGDSTASALVENCANNGHILNSAAILRSYTGGVVGRNNSGKVANLYNAGCVVSVGGCVGGALGLNATDSDKGALYNTGDVLGGDYEDDGYPTDNAKSSSEELAKAQTDLAAVLAKLGSKDAMAGNLSISGTADVGETVTAVYSETAEPVYVWYFSYGDSDDVVLAIGTEEYSIPQNMAGRVLKVKAILADAADALTAQTAAVRGLSGTLKISGIAVPGRTITAEFRSAETYENLHYQWYRGTEAILGANALRYTVTTEDVGKALTIKVTSSSIAGCVEASTAAVKTAEQADIWEVSVCSEPANVGGVYQISTEEELHWFATEVNGGNFNISAKLLNNIALTTDNWYPIGRGDHAFAGTFDGNGKQITNLILTSSRAETGFFGQIADGGRVKNLHVSGTVTATGTVSQTGGIAGTMGDGEGAAYLTGCSFAGSVKGYSQVGGIIGSVGLKNTVEQCSNTAIVSGTEQIGGIAGTSSYGYVRESCNSGAIGAETAKYVGGIVGDNQNYAELFACYNTGSVTGSDYIGGIAGNVYVASMPTGCYNTGAVSTGMHCGGTVGSFGGDTYISITTGSFYQGPLSAAFAANGAQMRTEAQMKASSFVTELNSEAYGTYFKEDAGNVNQGYPVLTWQKSDAPVIVGYTAAIGEDQNTNVGEDVTVPVAVNNSAETAYNAYHLTMTYDAEKLTYKSVNNDATVKDDNGTLTISGYGADKTCGTDNIAVTFTAKATGEAEVTLTSANIDKSANANTQDAPAAKVKKTTTTITIGGYTVTLPDDFTGEGSVAPGADYTFTAKDKNYDYNISATMGGTAADVVDNEDGTFTIKNVTGNLVITSTKSAKEFDVTVSGNAAADVTAAKTANYLTDYTFTVSKNAYFDYAVSATVGGAAYTLTQGENGKYTVKGADVTGDIVITVTKTRKQDAYTSVTFTGSGSADVVGGTTQSAPNGEDFLFSITEADGYEYTVTLGSDTLEKNSDGKYTIAGSKLTGTDVTVTVEKVGKIEVDASAYIELSGKTMWLVTARGVTEEGKVLAYDGNAMFWSEKYDAYCWLVVSDSTLDAVKADATAKIAAADAQKVSVQYDGDVNMTDVVDINDAQLTYDMYNAKYDSFDTVSMAKFLEADVNGDQLVNVTDAAAVIAKTLATA